MSSTFPSLISTLAAIAAGVGIWLKWRQSELRRMDSELRLKEVFQWSNDVISKLATLRLCILKSFYQEPHSLKLTIEKIALDTSILIEHGRLFFKNTDADPARGTQRLRPKILDWIVLAHKLALRIAANSSGFDKDERARMFQLADRCVKEFVHYAQEEVGRQRVVSETAAGAGLQMDVDTWLTNVDGSAAKGLVEKWLATVGTLE
jgi:hypothetical protein